MSLQTELTDSGRVKNVFDPETLTNVEQRHETQKRIRDNLRKWRKDQVEKLARATLKNRLVKKPSFDN